MDDNNYYQANATTGGGTPDPGQTTDDTQDQTGDDKPVDVPVTEAPEDQADTEQGKPVEVDTPEDAPETPPENAPSAAPEDTANTTEGLPETPSEDIAPETTTGEEVDAATDEAPDTDTATDETPDATEDDTDDTTPENPTGAEVADDQNPIDIYNNFVDRLITEFGYDKLEEPQKSKLIDAIKQRIETRVLRVLMTNLTQEKSDEIDKEVKEKGLREEDIVKLLSEKAPNASQAILTALDDLYLEMKQENDAIMKAAQNQAGQ